MLNKLAKVRVSTCVVWILVLVTIGEFFNSYGVYNYTHIPSDLINNELHKEISSKLVTRADRPKCQYNHIIASTQTLQSWEVPKTYDEFSVSGIANGSYSPGDCTPLFSVAILVPYRNREPQLHIFLPYMHNFLRKQNIHYKIFVIEQQDHKPWNKGALYNIGAKYAIAEKFPCLILHDIDMLPLDNANLYACTRHPRHMSASVDKFRDVLPYDWLVGGVLAITSDQYVKVNGFSKKYEGWGGEDDDFARRILDNKYQILRFPRRMSRYTMLMHAPAPRNEDRSSLLAAEARSHDPRDGYAHTEHRALALKPQRLFTLISVTL